MLLYLRVEHHGTISASEFAARFYSLVGAEKTRRRAVERERAVSFRRFEQGYKSRFARHFKAEKDARVVYPTLSVMPPG